MQEGKELSRRWEGHCQVPKAQTSWPFLQQPPPQRLGLRAREQEARSWAPERSLALLPLRWETSAGF